MDMPLDWVRTSTRATNAYGASEGAGPRAGHATRPLLSMRIGEVARIAGLRVHDVAAASDHRLVVRLLELGFIAGERVELVATGPWGGDPLAVRVGRRLFAIRRDEAERVELNIDPSDA